jgi:protease PrsW
MFNFLMILSLAPVIVLIALFYMLDKYEPEPKRVVLKVFAFGVVSVLPAAGIESIFQLACPHGRDPGNLTVLFASIFISIGLVEELSKFMVLILGIYQSPEFDEPYDGIIYSVAASLGFAALENILYVFSNGVGTGIMRAILSVPAHALFGVIMGYYLGRARFARRFSVLIIALGLFYAVLAHTVFDFLLFSQNPVLIICVFPFIGLLWVIVIFMIRKAQSLSFFRFNPQKEDQPHNPLDFCPQCTYSMPHDSLFCRNCGVKLRDKIVISRDDLNAAKHCPYCEALNPPGSLFCIKCGKKVKETIVITKDELKARENCPHCQYLIPVSSVFCINCGTRIVEKIDANDELPGKTQDENNAPENRAPSIGAQPHETGEEESIMRGQGQTGENN